MKSRKKSAEKIRAILLLSGGLDSTLAGKMLKDQGIELIALNFTTPFCTCTRKGCRSEARKVAEEFSIPIQIFTGGEEYIQIIKLPKYGYGKNMNPCIDCRIFMFSKAKSMMEETGARFIATGEVLGERPMSQRLWAMRTIERESGLEGLILRPLSARLLKQTIPEKEGWIDRNKLLAIQGRSRKPQMALAENLDITEYPCPAGGCRLTDPQFAGRLKDALNHGEDSLPDIHLLKFGRHFRLPSGAKVIAGRNEQDNKAIANLAPKDALLMECAEDSEGPTTLLGRYKGNDDILFACGLTLRYSDHPEIRGTIRVWGKNSKEPMMRRVTKIEKSELAKYRL